MKKGFDSAASLDDVERLLQATIERAKAEQRNIDTLSSIHNLLSKLSCDHVKIQRSFSLMTQEIAEANAAHQATLNLIAAYLAALTAGDKAQQREVIAALVERQDVDIVIAGGKVEVGDVVAGEQPASVWAEEVARRLGK